MTAGRVQNLTGVSGGVRAMFQCNLWADTYSEAKALADAVRVSLDGFIGVLTTIHTVCRLQNEHSAPDQKVGKSRIIQDYSVNHVE